MNVLNLVTTERSRFYRQQVAYLQESGVVETTLPVPGHHEYGDGNSESRSMLDYARFLPTVFSHAYGNGDYDLVHANYGLTAPHAVAQRRLPVVVSLWGSDLAGSYGWLSKAAARRADAVVVMSERMAAELGPDCHVIPHGVDLDLFTPGSQADARTELGWRDDAHHVLFPYPPKRAVKNYPRAERVVEDVQDEVTTDVALHTVSGTPHDEMPTYMNAADVLLLTSKREGSPNSVKEALACNLPVVSVDVGDVRERLDGVTPSRVADTDDDLVAGVVDVLRADERSNGREAAREVSFEHTTDRLCEVYRSVLDDAPD